MLELVDKILGLMGSDLRPEVRNEATQRDPAPVPQRRQGAQTAWTGSRCSRSTRGLSGRSPGTATFLGEARVNHDFDRTAARAVRPASCPSSRLGDDAARQRAAHARADSTEPEPTFPLDLVFCPACSLVQITETVPPEELFRDYLYFSSFSDTMLQSRRGDRRAARRASASLGGDSLVVEVASNDGYLLQYYAEAGVPVLGHRAGRQHRRGRRGRARHPDARCEFFGERAGARGWSPRASAPTSSTPTTCWRTCPTSTASSRASRSC